MEQRFGKPEVALVATTHARTNCERREAPLHNRCTEYLYFSHARGLTSSLVGKPVCAGLNRHPLLSRGLPGGECSGSELPTEIAET